MISFKLPSLGFAPGQSVVFQHQGVSGDLPRAAVIPRVKSLTCCSFLLVKAQLLTTTMAAAVLGNVFSILLI